MQPEAAKSFLPIRWDDAHGEYVWDDKKKQYIDFTSGIFVANVGHCNFEIWDMLDKEEVSFFHSYNYSTDIREKYTDALCKKTGFECVALFSAGCETVEAALRVMWKYHDGRHVGFTPGIFMHGKTYATTMKAKLTYHLGENEMLCLDVSHAGIILESYRGWDAHFWDKKWIQDLRAYCTENDILLCFDEIQSGFGRTGRFFCYEHYEVVPDLVCIGKAMGGGFPLSGLLGSKHLLDLPGDLSSTHSGNPLACAAGQAVLEEFDRLDLVKESERKGEILHGRLKGILPVFEVKKPKSWIPNLSGRGMVAAIMMPSVEEANRVVMECYKRGLLVVHTGRESVKIGPPLVISDEALNKGLDILEEVLND